MKNEYRLERQKIFLKEIWFKLILEGCYRTEKEKEEKNSR